LEVIEGVVEVVEIRRRPLEFGAVGRFMLSRNSLRRSLKRARILRFSARKTSHPIKQNKATATRTTAGIKCERWSSTLVPGALLGGVAAMTRGALAGGEDLSPVARYCRFSRVLLFSDQTSARIHPSAVHPSRRLSATIAAADICPREPAMIDGRK
jgi:hypothetical protein